MQIGNRNLDHLQIRTVSKNSYIGSVANVRVGVASNSPIFVVGAAMVGGDGGNVVVRDVHQTFPVDSFDYIAGDVLLLLQTLPSTINGVGYTQFGWKPSHWVSWCGMWALIGCDQMQVPVVDYAMEYVRHHYYQSGSIGTRH